MSNHSLQLGRLPASTPTLITPRTPEVPSAGLFLGFLDRNLGRFTPIMQNTIGFSVTLLFCVVTLHASLAPTFVSGKLFVRPREQDDKEFARSYMLEYEDATSVVTEYGSWMLPIRFGVPRKMRVQVLDSNSHRVGEVSFFGPWPVLNALYPMEYQITVEAYKPVGERVNIITRRDSPGDRLARILERSGLVAHLSAQGPGPTLQVSAHLQGLGAIGCASGAWCGTKGESRRLEGFTIRLNPAVPGLTVLYQCHVQDSGDTSWMGEGQLCGTNGLGRRLEGFAIRLAGPQASAYDVLYQAHVQNVGDTPVRRNGEFAGTRDQSLRVEAMKVSIIHRP